MIFLVMTSIYMLTYIDDRISRSRQLALTLTIGNTNLQILVLYLKREAFSRFIQDTPQFANKKVIEVQLKHAMKIIKPWTVVKGIVYVALLTHNLLSIAEKLRNVLKEKFW
jgi:hypothetical protein